MAASTSSPVVTSPGSSVPPFWQLALALGIVYVVWGSTYLAIRVAVLGMPPFLMAGMRFTLATAILLGAAWALGHARPTLAQLRGAAVVGMFLLVGGNGLVVWSSQYIASGLAALLVASLPVWTLLLEALIPAGSRPTPLGLAGIGLGFVGVVTLMWPNLGGGLTGASWAQGLVLCGTIMWAIGTLIGRRVAVPASGLYNSGIQMGAAALGFAVLALAFGEPGRFVPAAVPASAWYAFASLVVFGSCVAFSAYAWLVQHARPELVATYAYVNPVVAVALGALILAEPVTAWTVGGAAMIVASVVLVIKGGRPMARLK